MSTIINNGTIGYTTTKANIDNLSVSSRFAVIIDDINKQEKRIDRIIKKNKWTHSRYKK